MDSDNEIFKCLMREKSAVNYAREIWVDNVKVVACILVVLGHFFQSMVASEIIADSNLYEWFNTTIYYFHVPLFFICSGYLYQRYSKVNNFRAWKSNVLKKLVALGIPYFTFSTATWVLKTIFSGAVNSELGGIFETLFVRPTSPYWYLYALFFIFLVTPTFADERMAATGLVVALAFKIFTLIGGGGSVLVILYILNYEIWFVMGMELCMVRFRDRSKTGWAAAGTVMGILFLALSVLIYCFDVSFTGMSFLLGVMACMAVILVIAGTFEDGRQNRIFGFLAKYTMPIFLMHTLFAAPVRIILLKFDIFNPLVHMTLGITISFVGPIIAALIMEKTVYLEFFLYPQKVVRRVKSSGKR